jgi:hypothetical protein
MNVDGPTNPFHLARAYGTALRPDARQAEPSRVAPLRNPETLARIAPAESVKRSSIEALVAGTVAPASAAAEDVAATGSFPLYRNPALRHAAAVNLANSAPTGSTLDTRG